MWIATKSYEISFVILNEFEFKSFIVFFEVGFWKIFSKSRTALDSNVIGSTKLINTGPIDNLK